MAKKKAKKEKRAKSDPMVRVPEDRHFVDQTLPYNYEYHKKTGGKFDEMGRCVFDSPKQMRELRAMANDSGEGIRYTGSGIDPMVPETSLETAKRHGHGGTFRFRNGKIVHE